MLTFLCISISCEIKLAYVCINQSQKLGLLTIDQESY